MNWFLTAILCVLLVELVRRLPFSGAVTGLQVAGNKALHTVRAPAISDHWKEKAMAAYAQATFVSTLRLLGLLVIVFAIAFAMVTLFDKGSAGFQRFILGWRGLTASLIFASLYCVALREIARGRRV